MPILTKKQLEKIAKEKLVAMLDDMAEALEIDVEVQGNKDELIERYQEVTDQYGDPDTYPKVGVIDQAEGSDQSDPAEGEGTEDLVDSDGADLCIEATGTFEIGRGDDRVCVVAGKRAWLSVEDATAAIDAGLAFIVEDDA